MNTQTENHADAESRLAGHVICESLTIPERITIYKTDPSHLTPNPERSSKRTRNWRHALGLEEEESASLRLASLGITEDDLAHVLETFASLVGNHLHRIAAILIDQK